MRTSQVLPAWGLVCLLAVLTTSGCQVSPSEIEACCPAGPDDWPQFRGLARDGIASSSELAGTWEEAGLEELWRLSIGPGFSGISVKGNGLYSQWTENDKEVLYRLDSATGQEIWRRPIDEAFEEEFGDGPRSTPTVDDREVLFALSSKGKLWAVKSIDGEVLWSKDLHRRYGGDGYGRGYASSPLIFGELVILHVGPTRSVVALNRQNGEEIWAVGEGRSASSSAIVAAIDGKAHVVSTLGEGLVGLDPATGRELWSFPWPTKFGLNIAMPVAVGANRFMISSGYDQGAALVEVTRNAPGHRVEVVWENRLFRNHFSTSVVVGDAIYGFDNGILKCLNASSGEVHWMARGYGKGSVVVSQDQLIVLSDDGDLALLRATPERHVELARVEGVLAGKSWTSPTLAEGRLYVRNHSELVALGPRGATP